MSLAAIALGVRTVVEAVSGIGPVFEDEPHGADVHRAMAERRQDGILHFWIVRVTPAAGEHYAGGVEPRYAIRVEGFYGVARDVEESEDRSDRRFAELAARVVQALEAPANRNPGDCVETTPPTMPPISRRRVKVGAEEVPCHYAAITYAAQEE